MNRRAAIAVVGLLAGALLLVGCGGDDADDGAQGLTKAEFVQRADAICDRARGRLRRELEEEDGDLVSGTVKALRTEAKGLAALDAPSEEAAQIDAIVAGARKTVAVLEANSKDIARATVRLNQAERLADDYGLETCLVSG